MTVTQLKVNPAATGAAPLRNIRVLDELLQRSVNRDAHLPGIMVFSGPSGFGKSTAVAAIAATYDANYVEVRSVWTKKAFLEAVLKGMGIKPGGTIAMMADQVSEELALSQRPLLVDEADNLIERNLVELVRDLYEQSKAPIVLIGEEMLPQKLARWERFHGRILDWAQALPVDIDDARRLVLHYTPDVTVQDDLLLQLVKAAKGSVRRVVTNLDTIVDFARSEGLEQIGAKEWAGRKLHTSVPPQARRF